MLGYVFSLFVRKVDFKNELKQQKGKHPHDYVWKDRHIFIVARPKTMSSKLYKEKLVLTSKFNKQNPFWFIEKSNDFKF